MLFYIIDYTSAGASPYSMSGTPGPMMSPPPGEDSMGYGIPGMNGSGYSGVGVSCYPDLALSVCYPPNLHIKT